jgi:hypothetical protein
LSLSTSLSMQPGPAPTLDDADALCWTKSVVRCAATISRRLHAKHEKLSAIHAGLRGGGGGGGGGGISNDRSGWSEEDSMASIIQAAWRHRVHKLAAQRAGRVLRRCHSSGRFMTSEAVLAVLRTPPHARRDEDVCRPPPPCSAQPSRLKPGTGQWRPGWVRAC